jgi:hypothetical protein
MLIRRTTTRPGCAGVVRYQDVTLSEAGQI